MTVISKDLLSKGVLEAQLEGIKRKGKLTEIEKRRGGSIESLNIMKQKRKTNDRNRYISLWV